MADKSGNSGEGTGGNGGSGGDAQQAGSTDRHSIVSHPEDPAFETGVQQRAQQAGASRSEPTSGGQ
ncbi:MAG TPA: hypothetical protein VFE05_07555 [Longimicrobiaceae bacterium]|jgi:hypothetical protein|nr:hypothetical protein [Longimicrobiaceae bacterium]